MKKHPARSGNKSRRSTRPAKNRSLVRQGFESLELRSLLAGDTAAWQNPHNHLDVNGDGRVAPLDALVVINELNLRGVHILASSAPSSGQNASSQAGGITAAAVASASSAPRSYVDVNGDNMVSALDALIVTNALNQGSPSARISLQAVDLNGNSITQVVAGTDFKIQAIVTDLRTEDPTGVFGAYFDVTYDSTKVTVESNAPTVFDPQYLNGIQKDYATAGVINETGSFATGTTPLGSDPRVLYTITVHANTSATGNLTFTPDPADVAGNNILLFGENVPLNPANNEVEFTGTTVQVVNGTLPKLTIGDVAKTELNSGQQQYVFTVNLSAASGQQVTVNYATQSDGATSGGSAASGGSDFAAASGTLTFAAGETSKTITVLVNGDAITNEGNETFNVNLSGAVNADIGDSRGLGTITDDDPTPSITISDPSVFESNAGNNMVFTLTLSAASQKQVLVNYTTANGTALAGSDFVSAAGTVTFAPGATSRTVTVVISGDTNVEQDENFTLGLSSPVNATLAKNSGTGTILNDDGVALPTVSISDNSRLEGNAGNSPLVFTLALSAVSTAPVTVVVSTSNGTATAGSDYTAITAQTVTFAPNTLTATATVQVTGDATAEPNETFNVTLSNPAGATIATGTAVGTILDDDSGSPTITIGDVTSAEGNSGSTNFVFPVTLSAAPGASTVTVVVNTAGVTANSPSDFAAITNQTLTFTGVLTAQNVTVQVVGDTALEQDETFNVNLSNASGANIAKATGLGTITNDDAATTISIGDVTTLEGTGGTKAFVFDLFLSATSASVVTVQASTGGGTATAGVDYTSVTNQVVTFQPGSTAASVTVTVVGDALDEANETFNVTLSNPVGAAISDGTGLGTITDDDNAPTVSINDVSQAEGNTGTTNFVFTVSLSAASGQQVLVPISTSGGTATAGTDYTQPADSTLTFAAGETTKTYTVSVLGDTTQESNETFNVNLSSPTNALVADGVGVGTILDDDGPPSLSINSVSQAEGNSGTTNFVFTVTMAGTATEAVTVVVNSSNGTATAGTDYTALATQTLTFSPGGATTQQVTVAVAGDTFFETSETFNVTLSNASGSGATISTATGVGTITNDDAQPSFSINDVALAEGNSGTTAFVFTVTKTGNSEQNSTVVVATSDGSATTANSDYAALTAQTLTFTSGGAATQLVTVQVTGDTAFESNETFNVNLSSPVNATISKAAGVGTINNDDGPPTLSIANVTSAEGNSGTTNFVFTVSLTGSASQPVTVVAASAVGSGANPATVGTDYNALAPQTLTFAVGETSKTVTVQVSGDTVSEADETFNVVLSSPTVATIGTGTAVGTISNDDGVPSISITDVTQNEGNSGTSNFVFTISLSAVSGQNITVVAASSNGTATAGTDYTALAAQTLTFTPGQTSKTVTVVVQGDTATEANETFNVNLTNVSSGATIAKNAGVGTITNDDGVPTVSIADAAVNEGNSGTTNLVFTVTLSGGSSNPVTVNFATAGLTATSGTDFTATSGTLTFAANETSKTITVQVVGDALNEANETFNVNLTAPTNASLGDGVAVGTITNDDPLPGLSINDVTLAEGNSGTTNFVFTVTLSAVSGQTVKANFATADGTAIAGVNSGDYTATSGTLTFAPGETTKSITVGVRGDLFDEPNQTFTVNLTAPSNATLTDGVGTGTITNDDVGGGVEPANVSGFVYIDTNNGGSKDPNEKPISGVIVKLTGKNEANQDVALQTTTDAAGAYSFVDIEPGTYTITETQPASYLDGTDRPGSSTVTSTVNDAFTFSANGGENLVNNNFGERGLRPELISKRATLASSANVTNASVQALNVSANDQWIPYDAGWDGTLTAQASASGTGGNPTLALYDNALNLLASGSTGSTARLDWNGIPGAPYFLRVGGGNTSVDLTMTNLVKEVNGVVTVNGTAGDDNFEFTGGSTQSFSINGVSYELNPANVSKVVFNGGGGHDTATLTGSDADDQATLGLGFGNLTSASYNVTVNNVASLAVNGGGGNDRATLQDSALADHLTAAADWLSVSSADELITSISGFDSVKATASHGGGDTSEVQALDFVLERLGDWS